MELADRRSWWPLGELKPLKSAAGEVSSSGPYAEEREEDMEVWGHSKRDSDMNLL